MLISFLPHLVIKGLPILDHVLKSKLPYIEPPPEIALYQVNLFLEPYDLHFQNLDSLCLLDCLCDQKFAPFYV